MNFDFLFFCRIWKVCSTIAYGKKNLTEERIDFEEETGDRVLTDEESDAVSSSYSEAEYGGVREAEEDDAEGDEEDDEEGEEVMDFFF